MRKNAVVVFILRVGRIKRFDSIQKIYSGNVERVSDSCSLNVVSIFVARWLTVATSKVRIRLPHNPELMLSYL